MTALIKKAWLLRWTDDLEGARQLYAQLLKKVKTERDRAELDLLQASFLRRQLRNADAQVLIADAARRLASAGLSETFQLLMQTAICMGVDSKFAESLLIYLRALKLAGDANERFMAKYNIAVARFNLGLEFDNLIEELSAENGVSPSLHATLSKFHVMRTERAFLNGDFNRLPYENFELEGQALYQKAWLKSLPWFNRDTSIDKYSHAVENDPDFFGGVYGLETIRTDRRWQSGANTTVLQRQVDRLYLWTWKWLAHPSPAIATLLADEIVRFPFLDVIPRLTVSDFHMLTSVGRWLSLYSSSFARAFEIWHKKYELMDFPKSVFFEIDELACRSVSQGDRTTIQRLKNESPQLNAYLELVESFIMAPQTAPGTLSVDTAGHTLTNDSQVFVSEPAVRLVEKLKSKNFLRFSDALAEAFGIHEYDDVIHAPKIRNLIQRLKTFLPDSVKLYSRQQIIYLEDPKALICVTSHSRSFPELELSFANLPKKQVARHGLRRSHTGKKVLAGLFADSHRRSALEIQTGLGLSRATTRRMIKTWIASGVLLKTGDGRNTKYGLK